MALLVNDNTPRVQYTASASQTVFAYPFAIFEDADLKVYQTLSGVDADDSADIQTLTTHYTVSGAGTTAGGNVTLVTGAAAGDIITIERDIAVERTTDYQNLGDLASETFNDDLDKMIMMVQQNESQLARTFKVQSTDSDITDFDYPTPVAGAYLRYNATKTGIEAGNLPANLTGALTSFDSVAGLKGVASATDGDVAFLEHYYTTSTGGGGLFYWNATSTDTDNGGTIIKATAITTGRWIRFYSGDVDVKWFGLLEDASDETAVIQSAINLVSATGGTVNARGRTFSAVDIALKSNVKLDLTGSTVTKIAGSSSSVVLKATGVLGATENITVNVAESDTVLTVADSSDFTAGDWAVIRDDTYISGSVGRNFEIVRIASLTATTITLTAATIGTYLTANSPQIIVLTPIKNMKVIGGILNVDTGTNVGGGIWSVYTTDSEIIGTTIKNPESIAGIRIDQSSNIKVTKNTIKDGQNQTSSGTGYGISVGESSHHINIEGNYIENVRESVFSDRARHSTFTNNILRDAYDNGVNTHGSGSNDITIANNILHNCNIVVGYGSQLGVDTGILITGNVIRNAPAEGINISGHASDSAKRNDHILVSDNIIDGFGIATNDSKAIQAVYCVDVDIKNNKCYGKGLATADYGFYTDTTTDCIVKGNTFDDVATSGMYFKDTVNLIFDKNEFKNITTKGTDGTGNTGQYVIVDKQQEGETNVSFSSSTQEAAATTFPTAFEVAPFVMMTAKNAVGNFSVQYAAPTTTAVTGTLTEVGGAARTGTAVYGWIAIPQSL